MQQLEELDDTRNRLAKMQAKVEDLQAQLETKVKVERYLFMMDNAPCLIRKIIQKKY